MKKNLAVGAAVLTVVGLGGGLAASSALAQDPSSTPTPSSTTSQKQQVQKQQGPGQRNTCDGSGREDRGPGRGQRGPGMDVAALARTLGVDQTRLQTALDKAREANRPEEPGAMQDKTPAQRDAAREANRKAVVKAVAKELNLKEADVQKAMDEQRTTRQAERLAQVKTQLDQAVKDGKISKADSDSIIKAHKAGVLGGGHGPGKGGMGKRGR